MVQGLGFRVSGFGLRVYVEMQPLCKGVAPMFVLSAGRIQGSSAPCQEWPTETGGENGRSLPLHYTPQVCHETHFGILGVNVYESN